MKIEETKGKITNKDYQELFKVSKNTANRDLKDLLNKKLIEKRGSGSKIHYILKTTVRYRLIPSDETNINKLTEEAMEELNEEERAIINYIKEQKKISRKECVKLLDISPTTCIQIF